MHDYSVVVGFFSCHCIWQNLSKQFTYKVVGASMLSIMYSVFSIEKCGICILCLLCRTAVLTSLTCNFCVRGCVVLFDRICQNDFYIYWIFCITKIFENCQCQNWHIRITFLSYSRFLYLFTFSLIYLIQYSCLLCICLRL